MTGKSCQKTTSSSFSSLYFLKLRFMESIRLGFPRAGEEAAGICRGNWRVFGEFSETVMGFASVS